MPGFLRIESEAYPVSLARDEPPLPDALEIARDGDHIWIHHQGRAYEFVWQDAVTHFAEESGAAASDVARAPMPGAVVSIAIAEGDIVTTGETLLIIESMKLETAIRAPRDGVVETLHVTTGQNFDRDALLVTLEAQP